MKRNTTGVIVAIVIAAIATFVLVAYVRDAKDRAVAGEKLVDVLVATKTVSAGTPAAQLGSATKTERVPAKVRADGAIQRLKDVQGLVAATDLFAGEELLHARFTSPGQITQGVGEVKVPTGFVEVTLSLEPQRAVGGQIRPGDKVAAFGSVDASGGGSAAETAVIGHQVLVSNVQFENKSTEPSRDETKTVAPVANLLVTLAVDDPAAQKILFFAEHGKVWLGAEEKATTLGASQ
jgi:pilus assembly protein CpaB